MAKHVIEVNEGQPAVDAVGVLVPVETATFKCLNPIFKNGKSYKKGQKIELEVETGRRFVEAGDIEELKK